MMYKITGIILFLVYTIESQETDSPAFIVNEFQGIPNIVAREQWGGKSPKGPVSNLKKDPPPYVVVHHSATESCTSQVICQAKVRSFMDYHINHNHWSDIGYNFLVAEDGNVYEGRGWSKQGAHAPKYNAESIGICVIGDFTNREPNSAAMNALKNLISYGVSLNKIKNDYHLIGHRQASSTTCPGNKLFNLIRTWPHWQEKPTP